MVIQGLQQPTKHWCGPKREVSNKALVTNTQTCITLKYCTIWNLSSFENYCTQLQRKNETRWLYCVEYPQYSTRLEALGYLCDCLSGRLE